MKCEKCGYDDRGTGDFAHYCGKLNIEKGMNERIKELAGQAGFKVNWQHEDMQTIKMAQYREFVELVVKECAELFDPNEQSELGYRIGDRIYKHFGIK